MASLNQGRENVRPKTHEGGLAKTIGKEAQLRRSVMSCMLWEDTFYEDGVDIGTRIQNLSREVPKEKVIALALEAKYGMNLRHVPLWMMVSGSLWNRDFIEKMIRRPDDMMEIHESGGKYFARKLELQPWHGLRAVDFGELITWGLLGGLMLPLLLLLAKLLGRHPLLLEH